MSNLLNKSPSFWKNSPTFIILLSLIPAQVAESQYVFECHCMSEEILEKRMLEYSPMTLLRKIDKFWA